MDIFDFTVNTRNATLDDFNNAVDVLRYMDARSNWNTESYSADDRPDFFDKKPLTYEEYENWIKAVYVFIERCMDFYAPSENFDFPYRKFDMRDGIERYLIIYIMMEYMKKQQRSLFVYEYFDDDMTDMEKELSAFVNTSPFIRAFVIAYKSVVDFDMDQYKDFGRSFKESAVMGDLHLDCFPLAKTFFEYKTGTGEWDREEISLSYMRYVACDGKLYRVKSGTCYLNEDKIRKYFELYPEYKVKFEAVINGIKDNKVKKEELERERCRLWDERANLLTAKEEYEKTAGRLRIRAGIKTNPFYLLSKRKEEMETVRMLNKKRMKISRELESVQAKLDFVKKQIYELSGKNIMSTFLLSLPDFIPYREV